MLNFNFLDNKTASASIFKVKFFDPPKVEWPHGINQLVLDYRLESAFRFEEHIEGARAFFKDIPCATITLQLGDVDLSRVVLVLRKIPELFNRPLQVELFPLYHLQRVGRQFSDVARSYDSFAYSEQVDRAFIFMNRSVNISRYKIFEKFLKNAELQKNSYISWLNRYAAPSPTQEVFVLDSESADETQHLYPKQYSQSLVDVFCETNGVNFDLDPAIITEKTWRPLLTGHLFLGFGFVGYNSYLEKLGFKLYNEFFDYSFDLQPSFQTRIEMYFEQLVSFSKRFKSEDSPFLIESVKDKIQTNRQIAKTLALMTDVKETHLLRKDWQK